MNKRYWIQSPAAQLLWLIFAIAVSMLSISILRVALAPLFGLSAGEMQNGATVNNLPLARYLIVTQNLGLFLLPPILAALFTAKKRAGILLGVARKPLGVNAFRTVLMVLVGVPFISFAADVNSQFNLPEWAIELEQQTVELNNRLLLASDVPTFLINLLIMAILPAIGEELLFRGYLQRLLCDWFKKPHFAICITAIIFSTFHLQFAGFIPRFLLGAAFGYLFYWSKSLWLPIIAHFANNAIIVCTYFYIARNDISFSQELSAVQGSTITALLSVFLAGYFLFQIWMLEKSKRRIRILIKKIKKNL